MLGDTLGNVDEITLRLDIGTELGLLDVSFDGSNDGKLEGLFIGDSLVTNDDRVLVSDEVIILGSTDGKVLGECTWICSCNHTWG